MVVTIMRQLALIAPLLAILLCSFGCGMNLHHGVDGPGRDSSIQGFSGLYLSSSFVAGNGTSVISPILLDSEIFPYNMYPWRLMSGSAHSHPLLPVWSQYSFFLPFPEFCGWSSGGDEGQACINDLLDHDENSSLAVYEIPSLRQFALKDGYKEGVEAHDDQTRMGLNHFLDDDEPPKRPLL